MAFEHMRTKVITGMRYMVECNLYHENVFPEETGYDREIAR